MEKNALWVSYLTLHASDLAVLYNKFVCNHNRFDFIIIIIIIIDESEVLIQK